jgi:pimeloyl-ACP methyl ester carboxylesterase
MQRQLAIPGRFVLECLIIQVFLLLSAARGWAAGGPTTRPLVVHLPGIGGFMFIDRGMIAGLVGGGVKAQIQAYDWTVHDPGIDALHDYDRNHKEAAYLAEMIARHAQRWPDGPIVITSHSGGGGIAVWTLEKLPPGVMVDAVFLMAPALSPGYDLSAALRHVRGHMYVFYSKYDYLVLGAGCTLCGTIDGELTDAAGYVGFVPPKSADPGQYKKLDQIPYDPAWLPLGNFGDHVGAMARRFVAKIIAPLVTEALDGQSAAYQPASP